MAKKTWSPHSYLKSVHEVVEKEDCTIGTWLRVQDYVPSSVTLSVREVVHGLTINVVKILFLEPDDEVSHFYLITWLEHRYYSLVVY